MLKQALLGHSIGTRDTEKGITTIVVGSSSGKNGSQDSQNESQNQFSWLVAVIFENSLERKLAVRSEDDTGSALKAERKLLLNRLYNAAG